MENLLFFGVPKFGRNYSLNIFSLNIVTPKTIDFPFGTNGKSMILSVPILKHFRVLLFMTKFFQIYMITVTTCRVRSVTVEATLQVSEISFTLMFYPFLPGNL